MAVNTSRDVAVCICMTEITGKGRVLARTGDHLLVGACMAGDTNRLVLAGQGHVQRLMRIVATQAGIFHFVMRAAFMAVAALRNVVS